MSKKKSLPKVVIDTNLLVAAFFNKKSCSFKILEMAKENKINVLFSNNIENEAKLILGNIIKSLSSKKKFKKRAKLFKKT